MSWEAVAAIGQVMGGLSGVFGRKKNPSPRDNIMSQAAGARDAAAAYGFNPLTMLQYGNPGGTGLGASGPPLASFDMITQGFKEIGDITSGDADRRREQEKLKHELTKLEVERLRAGNASGALGGSSPLGNRAANVTSPGQFAPARVVSNPDRTSVQVAGYQVEPDMGWSDAEEIEKRYGDAVSWVYGLGTIGADVVNHRSGPAVDNAGANKADTSETTTAEEEAEMRDADIRLYGDIPAGRTPDGKPFWNKGRGITFTPPNKWKN